jgi:hypothetical protein
MIAKLNLFPLSFKTDFGNLIDDKLTEFIGFKTKSAYREFMIKERFPKLAELVNIQKPKLIVGTSTTHLLNYVMAFSGQEDLNQKLNIMTAKENEIVLPNFENQKTRKFLYHLQINKDTTLIVCPFLGGQSGIKSDDDCSNLGRIIGNFLKTKKVELRPLEKDII